MIYIFLGLSALAAGVCASVAGWFDTLHALWQVPLCFVGCFVGLVILFLLVAVVSAMIFKLMPTPERPNPYYRFLADVFCLLILPLAGVRIHVSGTEKMPTEGRFMLVCNHLFAFDPAIVFYALPGTPMSFISKKENEKLFLVSDFLRALACLSIDRENDRAALKTILTAIERLKQNKTSIAVFPEGGTSKDGKLAPMRSGVFKIAQKAQVPIVVCVLDNTPMILKNLFRRRTDVRFDVLGVIEAESYAEMTTVEIGERVHAMMAQALGE